MSKKEKTVKTQEEVEVMQTTGVPSEEEVEVWITKKEYLLYWKKLKQSRHLNGYTSYWNTFI